MNRKIQIIIYHGYLEIFLLLLALSELVLALTLSPNPANVVWTYHISLRDSVQLKWTTDDPIWITVEMSAPTKGYLGIGISPHGGMAGSDIALGWVDDDGQIYFKDYHGIKNGAPIEDPKQDYELIYAREDSLGTKIVFRRKWDTCDLEHDQRIGNDTVRVIWAWHPVDPNPMRQLVWHGPGLYRGVLSINFKTPGKRIKFPDNEENSYHSKTEYLDITMYNVRVPKPETYYHCQIFKFPTFDRKQHIIGYRPLITMDHEPYIRHISIHICHIPKQYGRTQDYFEKYLTGRSQGCLESETSKVWMEFCVIPQLIYSAGGEGTMLPEYLGIPVGESQNEPTYVRLEIQYENSEGADLLDSSGLRIFYTPASLTKYDTGMLLVGHRRTPFLTVPPFQHRFNITGYCFAECTQMGIPKRGVKIFSVLLNSHSNGRKMTLRHFREGRELRLIAQENHYDFIYQEYLFLSKEVEFLPGDEILLDCEYDTSERNEFTLGGPAFENELCEAVILYYPKASLRDCRSQPEFYSYFNALAVGNVSGSLLQTLSLPYSRHGGDGDVAITDDTDVIYLGYPGYNLIDVFDTMQITSPKKFIGLNWIKYLNGLVWTNEDFVKNVLFQWQHGLHYIFCSTSSEKRIQLQNVTVRIPSYKQIQTEAQICDGKELIPETLNKSIRSICESYILALAMLMTLNIIKI